MHTPFLHRRLAVSLQRHIAAATGFLEVDLIPIHIKPKMARYIKTNNAQAKIAILRNRSYSIATFHI